MTHGRPRPRNTLTELEPVIFPTAESAYFEVFAAVILAKVSGSEVPIATKVIAVTESLSPIVHPRTEAISPTTKVTAPIRASAMTNAGHPPPILLGGIMEKNNFQLIVKK